MTKTIPLTQGKVTLVDDEDFEWLNQWKWYHDKGYAARETASRGKPQRKRIAMHRLIVDPPPGMETDHRNGDGLDNRRCNLRTCTHKQNSANSGKSASASSRYKGVSWHRQNRKWQSFIGVNGRRKYLGCFRSEEQAARAYNRAALILFGEFARLNSIPSPEAA